MAYRISDALVVKVYLNSGRLVVKSEIAGAGKAKYLKTFVTVGPGALITARDNSSIEFSDIKAGNRITIDFMKIGNRNPLVKGISILN